jgi:hypothetical protein
MRRAEAAPKPAPQPPYRAIICPLVFVCRRFDWPTLGPKGRRTASNLVKMPQNFGSSAKVLRKPPPALSVSDAPLDARSARQLRSMFSRLVDAMALSGIPDSLFPE